MQELVKGEGDFLPFFERRGSGKASEKGVEGRLLVPPA